MARKWRYMPFKGNDNIVKITYLKKETKGPLGYIGKAESSLFGEVNLVIDHRPEKDRSYDFACSINMPDNAWVLMDKAVFDGFLQGLPLSRMTVFHEIGHSYYKDYPTPDASEARRNHVSDGTVSEKELKADRFAADFLGTDVVVKALQELIKDLGSKYNEEEYSKDLEIAKQEILLRIKALQRAK